jgi:hypothetical protein
VEVVLRIDSAEYRLGETDARWLAVAIRRTSVDAGGEPWDREARAAVLVADAISGALDLGSPRTIEVGRTAALGLLGNAFHDRDAADVYAHVAESYGVAALYLALRRFALDSVERRR